MSIPLINEVNKNDINTSIIAIKKNLERINTLLGLNNTEEIDTSVFATKAELEQAETELAPVDEVTLNNMQSVTSNAVAAKTNRTLKLVALQRKPFNINNIGLLNSQSYSAFIPASFDYLNNDYFEYNSTYGLKIKKSGKYFISFSIRLNDYGAPINWGVCITDDGLWQENPTTIWGTTNERHSMQSNATFPLTEGSYIAYGVYNSALIQNLVVTAISCSIFLIQE